MGRSLETCRRQFTKCSILDFPLLSLILPPPAILPVAPEDGRLSPETTTGGACPVSGCWLLTGRNPICTALGPGGKEAELQGWQLSSPSSAEQGEELQAPSLFLLLFCIFREPQLCHSPETTAMFCCCSALGLASLITRKESAGRIPYPALSHSRRCLPSAAHRSRDSLRHSPCSCLSVRRSHQRLFRQL